MKNTYEKVIEFIEEEFKGDYTHVVEGKRYIINMLEEEERINRNKYIGKQSKLDIISILDSFKFILRVLNNKETKPNLDQATEKYVVKTVNTMMQAVNESKKYGNDSYESDYKLRSEDKLWNMKR
ncbi:hypothetical protein TwortDSMZ_185 [Staphylococcus phage Twort]|uniref:Uncharacterized protein n=2 Tax=Staphylococcus phage Twort (strain DSM 17442 / HER 48) TaxID=2908167 RepID=A0A6H0X5H8_BPTWO|nr:ORF102 [Staphylococcus phage Twort]AAX92395.1 ORF102 [Staphylococcus phage Twort]QIW89181.1 hypothetical protein TwortDSMZ_185 [Staphylococcus phage Twort]